MGLVLEYFLRSGEFKDGERTGQGKLIYPDGKERVGEFKNGEFVGK